MRRAAPGARGALVLGALVAGCAGARRAPPDAAAADARTDGAIRAAVAAVTQPTDTGRVEGAARLLAARRWTVVRQRVPGRALSASGAMGAAGRAAAPPRAEGENLVVDVVAGRGAGAGAAPIVIGAHLDAVRLTDGRLGAGVVDNGAGVVAVLLAADALRARTLGGLPLRHPVRLVLFDLEEAGLLGSRHFVRTAAAPAAHAIAHAMVNVDIVDARGAVVFATAARRAEGAPIAAAMAGACGAGCLALDELPPGDDRTFRDAGVPVMTLAVMSRTDGDALRRMLRPGSGGGGAPPPAGGAMPDVARVVHTAADAMDRLDPQAVRDASDAVVRAVLAADAAPGPGPSRAPR